MCTGDFFSESLPLSLLELAMLFRFYKIFVWIHTIKRGFIFNTGTKHFFRLSKYVSLFIEI